METLNQGAVNDKNIADDYKLSWVSTAFFIGSVANASVKTILPISESLWGLMSVGVGIGIVLMYAVNFKEMLQRTSKLFWRSVVLFLCIYLLSALLIFFRGEPLDFMISDTAFLTFAWWIPSGVFACSVYDKSILYSVWVKASFIISAFAILTFFFYIPPEVDDGSTVYNMTFGFNIILPLLFQINELLKSRKLWLLAIVLFEIFTVFVYANRGILLSLIFFGIYKFAFESKSQLRRIVSGLLLILATIVMLSSIETIAENAVAILNTFGFESRTLNMLATGVVSDTSGRDDLWIICLKMIIESPIFGWGLGGEYYGIANGLGEEATAAYSPHNGIIQNFVCFGVFGGFISTIIILTPLILLKKVRDPYTKILIVIFCASRVVPNLVSGDGFFTEPKVAIYLYLFYFGNRNLRRSRNYQNE